MSDKKKDVITSYEALQKAEAQEPLQDDQGDFTHSKVEALEAMQLAKAGVEVPEDRIYYDDDDIQYDEDIDELTITSGIVELS